MSNRTSVTLPDDDYTALKALADEQDRTVAGQARHLLRLALRAVTLPMLDEVDGSKDALPSEFIGSTTRRVPEGHNEPAGRMDGLGHEEGAKLVDDGR